MLWRHSRNWMPLLKRLRGIREGISGKEAQPSITCSKLTMETLEHGAKYVQS